MKIEMCESLLYSWLRHVKQCQVVQTNWKVSPSWEFKGTDKSESLMQAADDYFGGKYWYSIFKQNKSLTQIIRQGECDLLGASFHENGNLFYAAESAFHTSGLNYGSNEETVSRIVKKIVRTAISLYGYFNAESAEILFVSPKINPSVYEPLIVCVEEINKIFKEQGFDYTANVIANDEFNDLILQPVLRLGAEVDDTSELFMRSYQLIEMFESTRHIKTHSINKAPAGNDKYANYKVGEIAKLFLRKMLENGAASAEEVELMQNKAYSKEAFGLDFPLLVRCDGDYDKVRYYRMPLLIYGIKYMMCSQWFETSSNNDRSKLLLWMETHMEDNKNTEK